MKHDLLLTDCRLPDGSIADLLIEDGRIAVIEGPGVIQAQGHDLIDACGMLITPGLTEGHLHPDKAFGLESQADEADSLAGAIAAVRAGKVHETAEGIREKTLRLLSWCLSLGTTRVRVHAEVDPLLELRSVKGVLEAREALQGRMHIEVVAFPQEGIVREPGTLDLMREALAMGCDVVGAISYQDPDVHEHLRLAAGLAQEFGRPLDVHADFGIEPEASALATLAQVTLEYGLEGRVCAGHCTTLAKMSGETRREALAALAGAAISVITLPRTDVYLDGVIAPMEELWAAGVPAFLATNNVRNAFTPVGRPSLPAVAATYALFQRKGSRGALDRLARSLWTASALCGVEAGLSRGAAADLCLWRLQEPWQIVAAEAEPVLVLVAGRVVAGAADGQEAHLSLSTRAYAS